MFFKVPSPWDTPGCSGLSFLLDNPPRFWPGIGFFSISIHSFPAHPSAPGMHIHPLQGYIHSGSSRGSNVGVELGKANYLSQNWGSLCPPLTLLGVVFLNTFFLNTCKSSGLGPGGLKRVDNFAFSVFLC